VDNPFAYMARARLFVLSSRWEGLPGVLIQAMACGTSVVSTDCPSGPAEILQGGRYGPLVPVGDAHLLTAAMAGALAGPVQSQALQARAGVYDLHRATRRYLEVMDLIELPAP
jgi:glycosyltransferase involved in cell wall biosynthesis